MLCLPYRNPIIAAKQVANIDVLSNGRLILGIGTGAPKSTHNVDFEVLGVERKTKYHVTPDYLRAMKAVWTEDNPSYEGEYIGFEETEIWPKPVQKPYPPTWTGGYGPMEAGGYDMQPKMGYWIWVTTADDLAGLTAQGS